MLRGGVGGGNPGHEQVGRQSEHLKDMLVGNILAVSWHEVGKTAVLYAAIGLFHFIFRHKFLAISMNHEKAEDAGDLGALWDFLFYASFGFVVTSSVSIAGVLLVFCYLIVPSVGAMLYARTSARGWRSGGRWGHWSRRWGCTVAADRFADGRDHRVHVRPGVDRDGGAARGVIRKKAAAFKPDGEKLTALTAPHCAAARRLPAG